MVLARCFERGNTGCFSGALFMPVWGLDSCKLNFHPWLLVILGSIYNTDDINIIIFHNNIISSWSYLVVQETNQNWFFPFPALFQVSVKGDVSLSILILRQFSNFIIKCELAACHCILCYVEQAKKKHGFQNLYSFPKASYCNAKSIQFNLEYFFILLHLLKYIITTGTICSR